jgi:hypothetical protein
MKLDLRGIFKETCLRDSPSEYPVWEEDPPTVGYVGL